ncbi:MAG: ribonuclease P protein component, partial [Verrucomicrobiota bacterium]
PNRRLPKKFILRGRNHFRLLKTSGARRAGKFLVCNYLKVDEARKVAFIIPKACGPAVTRNRIRRRMREGYRLLQDRILPKVSIVWIARRTSSAATYDQLKLEMEQLLQRSGLWLEVTK